MNSFHNILEYSVATFNYKKNDVYIYIYIYCNGQNKAEE